MRPRHTLVATASLLLAACSSDSSPGGPAPLSAGGSGGIVASGGTPAGGGIPTTGGVTSASGGALAAGGVTASGGALVTGGAPSSGGETGAGGAMVPPPEPDTVTVTMAEFTVAPGKEVFMCQDFANPFGGVDVAIGRSESNMAKGSHHLHVYYGANVPPDQTVVPCQDPFEFRPMIHLATIPTFVSEYPAGTAAKLKGGTGLRMQVHYLNTTPDPLVARVQLTLKKVDPATVTRWVGQMHFNRIYMQIQPGPNQVLKTSCKIPETFGPIGILSGVSHMHKRGVRFVAVTSTGKQLVDTNLWDEAPPSSYDPPVMLNPGDSIDWTCTYDNDTGTTLEFGDSAEKNEMCVYIARFFSSPDGDDLTCETPYSTATATATAAPNH